MSETFGKWLKRQRKEKGVSQLDVAKGAILPDGTTVTDAYISRIEREVDKDKYGQPTKPDRHLVVSIAKFLNVDASEALNKAGFSSENEELNGWFKGLEKLSPEDQKRAKRQIRAIIDSYIDDEEKEEDFDYI